MSFKKFFLTVCGAVLIFLFIFTSQARAAMVEERVISISAYVGSSSSVIFNGKACPFCRTTLLLGGVIKDTDICDSNSVFQLTMSSVPNGSNIFSIYSTDAENNQSGTASFNADISQGTLTYFSNIFISPTLFASSEVEQGSNLVIHGYTVANAEVTIILDSGEEIVIETVADADGLFYHTLATDTLALGTYSIRAMAESEGDISPYGKIIEFEVKAKDVAQDDDDDDEEDEEEDDRGICGEADDNKDGRVDLVDFSILLHWFRKDSVPGRIDLDNDGKVDLTDFSILTYCWSG